MSQPRPGAVFVLDGRRRRVVAVRPFASGGDPVVWHAPAVPGRVHVEQLPLSQYPALIGGPS